MELLPRSASTQLNSTQFNSNYWAWHYSAQACHTFFLHIKSVLMILHIFLEEKICLKFLPSRKPSLPFPISPVYRVSWDHCSSTTFDSENCYQGMKLKLLQMWIPYIGIFEVFLVLIKRVTFFLEGFKYFFFANSANLNSEESTFKQAGAELCQAQV